MRYRKAESALIQLTNPIISFIVLTQSFACWRPEALAEARAKLAHANAREEQAQDEYTKSIESFQSIPLRWDKAVSKALAFRKACQSQEKIHHS